MVNLSTIKGAIQIVDLKPTKMEMTLVPGYRDLFGEPAYTYEELMKNIPTQLGVLLCLSLNGELALLDPYGMVQYRLMNKMCLRFSQEQRQNIISAFHRYRDRTNGKYGNEFFERWYLLEMITRELNRNAVFEARDLSPQQEHNFLMAYMLIIDEVHKKQRVFTDKAAAGEKDNVLPFRMIWTGLLNQYEFQEKPDPAYEFYKLASMLHYALVNFRTKLREYLHGFGYTNIGNLMGSFLQTIQGTMTPGSDSFLPALKYYTPLPGVDDSHLRAQAINLNTSVPVKTGDIRRFPMFFRPDKGYAILDPGFSLKKIYRGPLFELRTNTSLNAEIKGDKYNSTIAKHVLEEICFTAVLKSMIKKNREVLSFDDGSDNSPDAFYQFNKTVFLFEFKGYLFPEKQLEKPDFDTFKTYLDERFVYNADGKRKGVSQLVHQIELMATGKATFAPAFPGPLASRKTRIYPVICFDDFYFTMPGVNTYLNGIFQERLSKEMKDQFDIVPLTLINLDILFFLSIRKVSFSELEEFVLRYRKIIKGRIERHKKTGLPADLLLYHSSFDEIFHTKMVGSLEDRLPLDPMTTLLRFGNITQETLDMEV